MNKKVLTVALAFFILTSLVSGSLAVYQIAIDDFADGDMEAAKFILTTDQEGQLYTQTLNIAPGDSQDVSFSIANFSEENGVKEITETNMEVKVSVKFVNDIKPLKAYLYNGETKLGETTGSGTFTLNNDDETQIFLANQAVSATYKLVFIWPDSTEGINDTEYVDKTASFTISVVGTQILDTTNN